MRNAFVLLVALTAAAIAPPVSTQERAPAGSPASADLPLDLIKLPQGFKIEVYASGVTNARELALGPKGTVFVGSRNKPDGDKVYALVDKNGDQKADGVLTIAKGLNEPNGVAVHNGSLYVGEISRIVTIRQYRVAAGIARRTGGRERHAAQGHPPRAEVHRVRSRRPPLRAGRRAVQHLRQGKGRSPVRVDSPDEAGWIGPRGVRSRCAQHRRLRLASAHARDVVHRQRPRQPRRRRAERRAEYGAAQPGCTSGIRSAIRETSAIPSSARPGRAANSRRPRVRSMPTSPRSACGSTPARCSPRSIATRSSSPSTGRGTARFRKATGCRS